MQQVLQSAPKDKQSTWPNQKVRLSSPATSAGSVLSIEPTNTASAGISRSPTFIQAKLTAWTRSKNILKLLNMSVSFQAPSDVQGTVFLTIDTVEPERKRMRSLSVESSDSLEDDDGPDATEDQSLGERSPQATDMLKTLKSAEETIKDLQHDIDRRETERQITAQAMKDQNMIIRMQKAEGDIRIARQHELLLTNEGFRKDIAWLKWDVRARDKIIAELREKLGNDA